MRRSTSSTLQSLASLLLAVIALAGATVGVVVSSADASPGSTSAPSTTTCPSTYPFPGNSDPTVPCTTTTTDLGRGDPRLTITYVPDGHTIGIVRWRACGYPMSGAGATVRLELNGVPTGPTGRLMAGGCTTDPHFMACLQSGHYDAVDVVQGYPSASATVSVSASTGCTSGGSTTGGSTTAEVTGSGVSKGGGGVLAFTGADVRRIVVIGVLAIMIGLVLLRVSHRRRSATR